MLAIEAPLFLIIDRKSLNKFKASLALSESFCGSNFLVKVIRYLILLRNYLLEGMMKAA